MTKLILLTVLALYSPFVNAQKHSLDIVCCTYHFQRKGYNENNVGVIYKYKVRHNTYMGLGRYRNSEGTYSNLVGIENRLRINSTITFKLSIGIVSGYERGTSAFILPTITLYDKLNISIIPLKTGGVSMSYTAVKW